MSHKGKGSIDSAMRMPSTPGLKGAPKMIIPTTSGLRTAGAWTAGCR